MYPIEEYYEATTIEEAVEKLEQWPDAKIISGGSDVLIKVREGRLAGSRLVSIHRIPELKGISMDSEGTIIIGAATSFSEISSSAIVKEHMPILAFAVDQVGGPQIRNVGTIGGNICNGVTSADSGSTLLVLEGELELCSQAGTRRVSILDFYKGPGKTVRKEQELLTAIYIYKKNYDVFYGEYIKYGKRNAMEIATLGCALYLKLDENNTKIEELRIGYGVAAPTPIRCYEAEKQLKGEPISEETREKIGQLVAKEVQPRTSWRASKEFRMQLIRELPKRAYDSILQQVSGKMLEGKGNPLFYEEEKKKPKPPVLLEQRQQLICFTVNGKEQHLVIDQRETLADVLRNRLGLTSVKKGCEVGECGACTVLVDGRTVDSCIYLAAWADQTHVLTVEGLKTQTGELTSIQQAFVDEAAVQCGFCTPGIIMSAVELLESGQTYTREELQKLTAGHLCRCTGYENILNALEKIVGKDPA